MTLPNEGIERIEGLRKEPLNGEEFEPLNGEEFESDASTYNSVSIEGDPEEPGKTETLSTTPDTFEIDKWIGRGLKFPHVQDDGHW